MSNARRIFGSRAKESDKAPTVNFEYYPAWDYTLEEQYKQLVMCNMFRGTMYTTASYEAGVALDLHRLFVAQDPKRALEIAVEAREIGVRHQPILCLVEAAKLGGTKAISSDEYENAFSKIIRTPKDAKDFALFVKNRTGGEGGRFIRRNMQSWLRSAFDPDVNSKAEYWAIKYATSGGGTEDREGYSIRDLFRAYHPSMSLSNKAVVDFILRKDSIRDLDRAPQIAAYLALKKAGTSEEKVAAIRAGRLPHEVASAFAGSDVDVWREIALNMPLFATLKHLSAFNSKGLLNDDLVSSRICSMFNDKEAIRRSMILPYRFNQAFQVINYTCSVTSIKDALRNAIELSVCNVNPIKGRTAVLVDCSGSMFCLTSSSSGHNLISTAGIFGLSVAMASANCCLVRFGGTAKEVDFSRRDSLLSQMNKFKEMGNTNPSSAIETLGARRFDTIVVITDGEQNMGEPFVDAVETYRRKVNSEAQVIVVDLSPTGVSLLPWKNGYFRVFGFGPDVLRSIYVLTGSQVNDGETND